MKSSKRMGAIVIGLLVVVAVGGVFLYQKATGDLRAHDDQQARLHELDESHNRRMAEIEKLGK